MTSRTTVRELVAAEVPDPGPVVAARSALRGAVVVTLVEAVLAWRYAVHDAIFHYWLHGAIGVALGLTALAIVRHAGIDVRWGAGEAALAGHLYASFPDLIHAGGRIPHRPWMDVFAWHMEVHHWAAPLLTTGCLALLAAAGLASVTTGRPRLAHATLMVGVALVGSAHLAAVLTGASNGA